MRRKLTPRIVLLSLICLGFTLCVRAERLSLRIYTSADGLGSSYKTAFGNLSGTPVPINVSNFLPDTQEMSKGVVVNQRAAQSG